ncbi:MAG: DNA polymerase III subunit alpha [Bacteroidales bacterium]|jgi:DNA polymerase-3 subunit alpha|nr:DNA polymerase III subunit alpha [Bacteroidales bacterium]
MIPFTHLHVHSQYSILDGAASIKSLAEKAQADGMSAVALTDHGTMFGIKDFHDTCRKVGIKPILGCETYVAERTIADKSDKIDRSGDHLILLAKNYTGYLNLVRLASIASTEGFYYKPRIDKNLLEQYHEGLIVASACLGGEIPRLIAKGDLDGAEKAVLWYREIFGADYYLEIQRHPSEIPGMNERVYNVEVEVAEVILNIAEKYGIKVIATNDVHFTNKDDAEAHDTLLLINTGRKDDDPERMRYTQQEWFKTTEEMNHLFADLPQTLENTQEIVDKVEDYELNSDAIMPQFVIPESFGRIEDYEARYSAEALQQEFGDERFEKMGGYDKVLRIKFESDYLTHLTYEGAKKRYGDPLSADVQERIDFELDVIKKMGFPGYFLIVSDFIAAARSMDVLVGPGRGSAAGSVVAFCTGITNIDPIRYDLLFERFLNPDRISMPDVDVDFDDQGRQKVIEWVTEKYGADKVSHICTFGAMAPKQAIRDVARVKGMSLNTAGRLSDMVPATPNMTFKKAYEESHELRDARANGLPPTEAEPNLKELTIEVLSLAEQLEGSIRSNGVHACGMIISRDPLTDHVPVMKTKDDEKLVTTQYDGHYTESLGLLKMDFLGLRTLTIIKETLENIRISTGLELDIDNIPMDDAETFALFGRGDTTAVFQFESDGMKKYLRELKPTCIEDLVAMNALYRPGPIKYIPNYIARKHGQERVEYDHPMMERHLKDSNGINVFQEQVMLLSRHLGNFTRGQSDTLRKAMGKKQLKTMAELKDKFIVGCKNNPDFMRGCEEVKKEPDALIEKIWKDWEAFASYAFNKSHAVCYADVAYRTAYLKAHYPAEFMAANMSCNLNNISEISKLMEESNRMGISVFGPDINESLLKFTVNKKGEVRFGLAAVKGLGEGPVSEIIEQRKNGPYKDVFDLVSRTNLQAVNKRVIEALAMSGAFDSFGLYKRSQFFELQNKDDTPFIEKLLKYGAQIQSERNTQQISLFGEAVAAAVIKMPELPNVPEWGKLTLLNEEKSVIGMYLSAHPLDEYKLELENFASREYTLADLQDMNPLMGKEIVFGGMVTDCASELLSKTSKPYSRLTLSDYTGSFTFMFFGRNHVDYSKYCKPNLFLLVRGQVEKSRFRDSNEFNVTNIMLLDEVRDMYIKSITLDLFAQQLTGEFICSIVEAARKNKGKTQLCINLWDMDSRECVQLFSRSMSIKMNRDFERFLHLENIPFKVN